MSDRATSAATTDAGERSLLGNRTFLRFLAGQFVTNAGDSLYSVAILWLVYQLSGSTAVTGLANALLLLPYLLQVVAGPLVDRLHLQRLLVATQVVQGVVVLVVPLAAATGTLSVGLLLAVIPTLAATTLLTFPVPTTLLPRIVRDDQLSRGNALLSTVTLGLDMIFDALGGLFIAAVGATALFLLDSLTFAVAAVLFAGMVVPSVDPGGTDARTTGGTDTRTTDGTDAGATGDDASSDEGVTLRTAVAAYLDDLRAGVDLLRGSLSSTCC